MIIPLKLYQCCICTCSIIPQANVWEEKHPCNVAWWKLKWLTSFVRHVITVYLPDEEIISPDTDTILEAIQFSAWHKLQNNPRKYSVERFVMIMGHCFNDHRCCHQEWLYEEALIEFFLRMNHKPRMRYSASGIKMFHVLLVLCRIILKTHAHDPVLFTLGLLLKVYGHFSEQYQTLTQIFDADLIHIQYLPLHIVCYLTRDNDKTLEVC